MSRNNNNLMRNSNEKAPPPIQESGDGIGGRNPHKLYNKKSETDFLCDIGLDLTMPKRIKWTEYLGDSILWRYGTEDEFMESKNAKRIGIHYV